MYERMGWGGCGGLHSLICCHSASTGDQLINTPLCTYKLSSLINNMDYDWNMI